MTNAFTVENPHTDDITKAWSKVDVRFERLDECDPEVARLTEKVDRLAGWLADAKEAVKVAKASKATHKKALDEALAELKAAEAANPELAAEVKARRTLTEGGN